MSNVPVTFDQSKTVFSTRLALQVRHVHSLGPCISCCLMRCNAYLCCDSGSNEVSSASVVNEGSGSSADYFLFVYSLNVVHFTPTYLPLVSIATMPLLMQHMSVRYAVGDSVINLCLSSAPVM